MRRNELIVQINELNLTNPTAISLRSQVVKRLAMDGDLPLHNGKLNLTALAALVGATRQIFYPGRGSKELIDLMELLNRHSAIFNPHSQQSATILRASEAQAVIINTVRRENSELRSKIKKHDKLMELIHQTGIIIL